jgi:UDP-glucose 4-epimerase
MTAKTKIHVTGSRGFLGRHVMQALADIGDVVGTDVQDLNIADGSKVRAYFKKNSADIIVHLAALKGNLQSWEKPGEFLNVNTMGTLHLLEAARAMHAKRFVFMSSLTVHGPSSKPINEQSSMRPIHPYGASKAAAEAFVHAYAATHGLKSSIFRPNFIVGPLPAPMPYQDNIIYDFIQSIENKNVIELAGDGRFRREWLHASDVALAIRCAIKKDLAGCESYILAANRVSMTQLAEKICAAVGRGRVTHNPSKAGFSLVSSSAKAEKQLNWKAQKSIDTIVSEIWNEYQERKNNSHHGNKPRHRAAPR